MKINRIIPCILAMFVLIYFTASIPDASSNDDKTAPKAALEQGYIKNTFSSVFAAGIVDVYNTKKSGFDWYTGKFFGWKPNPPEMISVQNGQPIRLTGEGNFSIASAARLYDEKSWIGKAFGGGGYFEAEIRIDVDAVEKDNGWPAFWGMSIEHMAHLDAAQWQGEENAYLHYVEVDIMEYMFPNSPYYGANMHDWYGKWQETCPPAFCKHSLPYREVKKNPGQDVDYNEFHTYGFLWVPATPTQKGWAQFYFDDEPIGNKIEWVQFNGQAPSNKKEDWTFGILDQQHLVMILGTGKNQPIEVKSMNVWQANDDHNLVN